MRLSKKMALPALAFLAAFPVLLSNDAFSHGDAPSTCENRYDAEITSMTLDNGTQTFDSVSDSGLNFDALIGDGYDVTFALHTANVSSMSNTLAGTTWYRHTAFGFGNGVCVDYAGPDEDISVTVHVDAPSGVPDGYQQSTVEWGSWPEVMQFTYGVTWHSAEQIQEPQGNDTESVPPELPANNDARDGEEEEEENEEEFEENDLNGRALSPFVFKDKKIEVSATEAGDVTEEQPLVYLGNSLRINGTLASYHLLNGIGVQQLYIISGNWSMTMNDTAVTGFDASFTTVRSDGAERQTFSLGNLTEVSDSDMNFYSDKISLRSELDYYSDTTSPVNATITLQRLNVIVIELEGADRLDMPVYGIVDKVIRIEDGQMQVMVRHFDMI